MNPQQSYPYPQQPVYVHVAPAPPQNTGAATAALVLGVLTFLTCGATSIPAVICGLVSLTSRNSGGRSSAVVGMVLGAVWLVGGTVWLVAALAVGSNASGA